jgi:hypothetical protein
VPNFNDELSPVLMMEHLVKELLRLIISTPGPVGLSALYAAKTLNLRAVGIYHTDFPQYVRIRPMIRSRDADLELCTGSTASLISSTSTPWTIAGPGSSAAYLGETELCHVDWIRGSHPSRQDASFGAQGAAKARWACC